MSLGTLCLAIYLILQGFSLLGVIAVNATLLGILALIAGIAVLVTAVHPVTLFDRK